MRDYELTPLLKLCSYIREEDGAKQWLLDNDYRELAEFWDAVENTELSFKWLIENKHIELAATVDAFHGKDQAKAWLIKMEHRELAALVDASDGNKTAVVFLLKAGYKPWLAVAREIYMWNQKNRKTGFWSIFDFGNPFR